jgi:hypothetical protein
MPEQKEKARACFEAEAANIIVAVCMPEVFARAELIKEERYRVRAGNWWAANCAALVAHRTPTS